MSGRSDRRAILAGVAACVAAGAAGAVTGSATARAAAERAGRTIDDLRILELTGRFDALENFRRDLYPQSQSPRVIEDDDARDDALGPIEAQQDEIIERLMLLNASSPEAVAAVLRSLALWAPDLVGHRTSVHACLIDRLIGWTIDNVDAIDGRDA